MKKTNYKALLISLAVSLGTGALAAVITRGSMQEYGQLYQPPLAPPGWLFPIVWTILFVLMGYATYLIWESNGPGKSQALKTYLVQLVVNFFWSILFFSFDAYILAFAWIILLWYLIFTTIQQFAKINQTAANLLIPYLAWVTFAGYLNLAIAIHSVM